jgi:hypothetical protein
VQGCLGVTVTPDLLLYDGTGGLAYGRVGKPGKLPGFLPEKIIVARGLPSLADPAGPVSASPVGSPAAAEAPFRR